MKAGTPKINGHGGLRSTKEISPTATLRGCNMYSYLNDNYDDHVAGGRGFIFCARSERALSALASRATGIILQLFAHRSAHGLQFCSRTRFGWCGGVCGAAPVAAFRARWSSRCGNIAALWRFVGTRAPGERRAGVLCVHAVSRRVRVQAIRAARPRSSDAQPRSERELRCPRQATGCQAPFTRSAVVRRPCSKSCFPHRAIDSRIDGERGLDLFIRPVAAGYLCHITQFQNNFLRL